MTSDPSTSSQRDELERAIGMTLPKRTALERFVVFAIGFLTYPTWLAPRTLRLWRLAKRATSWKRVCVMLDDATWWLPFTVFTMLVIPPLLVIGWIQRRLEPPLR